VKAGYKIIKGLIGEDMNKGIALWSLNRILRLFGLVFVIGMDDSGPTRIWIETSKAYDARCI